MVITLNEIREVFLRLLNGEISRDEADRWAWKRIEAFDFHTLEFEPECDEETIFSALAYLYGIDLQTSPGEYLHRLEDIGQVFEERWREPSSPQKGYENSDE